jgi:hypothetical protein
MRVATRHELRIATTSRKVEDRRVQRVRNILETGRGLEELAKASADATPIGPPKPN